MAKRPTRRSPQGAPGRTGKVPARSGTGGGGVRNKARKSVRATPGAGASGQTAAVRPARQTMARGSGRTSASGRGTHRRAGTPGSDAPRRQAKDYRVRRSGMSLSVKFMLVVSGMVATLMALFFITVFIIASRALEEETTAGGAAQVDSMSNLFRVYIQTIHNRQFQDALMHNPAIRERLTAFYGKTFREIAGPNAGNFAARGNPLVQRFRMDDASPSYANIDDFLDDFARGLVIGYQFHDAGFWQMAAADAFPADSTEPDQMFDALFRWLEGRGSRQSGRGNEFTIAANAAFEALNKARPLIVDVLQRAYHDEFMERYIRPWIAGTDGNVVGLAITRLDAKPKANVDEFTEPTGIQPSIDGEDVADGIEMLYTSRLDRAILQFHDEAVGITVPAAQGDENRTYLVALQFDADRVQGSRNRLIMFLAAIALLAVVIGISVSYFLANGVTKPINSLVEDVIHIAQGEYDHRTRMKPPDEIGVLARTIDRMAEGLGEAREIAREWGKQQHELNIAEEVVIHLLPESLPKIYGYDVYAFYNPSKEVGGDYYDFFEIDPNHVGMIVADVSGKGIPGAMVMTMARTVIRYEAQSSLSPRETFMRANRHIARDIKRGMFVTAFYLVLNTQTAEMTVASAGHNPLMLWRAQTGKVEAVNPNGIALGFDKGPIFDRTIREDKVQLYSGDRVLMYTDGVVEAMSPDGEEFSDERFIELIESYPDANSNQLTNIIVQSVMDHQGGGEQHDDITIVTYKLL